MVPPSPLQTFPEVSRPPQGVALRILEVVRRRIERYDQAAVQTSDTESNVEAAKIRRQLKPLAETWERYRRLLQSIEDLKSHYANENDPELRSMLLEEQTDLISQLDTIVTDDLPGLLLPPHPAAELPVIISINAGVGGSEAALFVQDLSRMYQRYAEEKGWKGEILSQTEGAGAKGGGGLRECTIKFEKPLFLEEQEVYGRLKWESGVHRVQRVPLTETQGRVHTSTAAVVILPIYPDLPDAPLVDPKDVKTEVMRSRGAGGQHVNKTESAVRLTHLPTGITVSMQDSRSQHQNRAWAWEILRARLSERKHAEEVEARRSTRRSQVKSSGRSDKIRTYNFPQDRVTDHRIGLSLTGIQNVLDGPGLDLLLDALDTDLQHRRLQSLLEDDEDIEE
ncbi:hypothetical protein TREMEDRAFT_63806 [Tremella mesenterica DSM 1558]|uniref:uncharacterized protein n=1 Tax=Tremella mesenterica (strain ATCC 24925 / CBS 8224 / DSM 1558 / NBRC 9311 / NRRL Y-6157 / RJB 2259-6 / UBC 559-6) TaxID=578456 RepID=UPI0003F49293|nr:uncharacterized protein TREMEDRAFT_63806 [Tremella mesenterica DSM 1558]EIW67918.1 hypothetical protein TREMEDRAFT_63806 [Tremella mesenterica DSM 1558]